MGIVLGYMIMGRVINMQRTGALAHPALAHRDLTHHCTIHLRTSRDIYTRLGV